MAPRFAFETTAEQAAAELSAQIKGKTVLITGMTPKSLGQIAASAIAEHGPAMLIFSSRTSKNIDAVTASIRAHPASANVPIRPLLLDLASQASIREAAKELLGWADVPKIDVVINNASVMAVDFALTPEGIESQFGINHAGGKPRIVQVTSRGFRFSEVRWDDINFQEGKAYNRWVSYGQSKTANMLYAVALGERLKPHGVQVSSLHPGMAPETNLGCGVPQEELPKGVVLKALKDDGTPNTMQGLPFKTNEQAGATEVIAAFDDSIDHAANGSYLYEGRTEPDTLERERATAYARGKEEADRLWVLSEKLVGQKFSF